MNYDKHFAFSFLGIGVGGIEALLVDQTIGIVTMAGSFTYFLGTFSMYLKDKIKQLKDYAWKSDDLY